VPGPDDLFLVLLMHACCVAKTPGQLAREKKMCALCGSAPSTPDGEHVLPRSFRRVVWPAAKGRYRQYMPDGQWRTVDKFDSIKLPMCRSCNEKLGQ